MQIMRGFFYWMNSKDWEKKVVLEFFFYFILDIPPSTVRT